MTAPTYERHIPFDGVHNFRDLGGYQTNDGRTIRWRTVFRSGEPLELTSSDLERARGELGIRTVIDLRGSEADAENRSRAFGGPPVKYHNVPLLDDVMEDRAALLAAPSMGDYYIRLLENSQFGKRLVNALQIVSETEVHPLVFHCSGGVHRTGLLAALLLGVLGVADYEIVADYAIKTPRTQQQLDRLQADPERAERIRQLPKHVLEAGPESVEMALSHIDRKYGSANEYVLARGAHEGLFTALKDALLK